jgi:hypothetical protein
MKLLLVALAALTVYAEDDCPAWRPMSEMSECVWPRNEDGKMSFKPIMHAFLDRCKVKLDWKGQTPPDVTDKHEIDFPAACGKCAYKFKCANREVKDGCFPLKAEKETCEEHGDVCDMPKTPVFGNCKWNMLTAGFAACVTGRADLPEWRREGYHQGGRFLPEQNCVPEGEGCKCCCHPYRPVKNGDAWTCEEVPERAEAEACPDFEPFNEWSTCLWYPLTQVAQDVNAHCGLADLVPGMNLDAMIQKRIEAEESDPDRQKMLEKLPKEKCGYCSFKIRCRKREHSDVCFGFDGDKKACGPDDCETCGQPCAMGLIEEGKGVPEGTVGTCDYHKMIMAYLRKRSGPFMKMMGNSYWKKRGFGQLMKFMPMGKCVEVDGACKCCCHPYVPSEDGSQCVLQDMCRLPDDMGIEWDTME